ncbi:MAG: glycosyltransferase [Alphaproteobacteria bacterium]
MPQIAYGSNVNMSAPLQIISTYHPIEAPWGGGNNFWRALFPELENRYGFTIRYLKNEPEHNPPPADIVFFNQLGMGPGAGSVIYSIKDIQNIRRLYPQAKMVVRAINFRRHARYNSKIPYKLAWSDQAKDRIIKYQMKTADFAVFQSLYQKNIFESHDASAGKSTIIHNGAPIMFAEKGRQSPRNPINLDQPLRFLATSVSGNPRNRLEQIARLSEMPNVEITHAGFWHKNVDRRRVKTLGTISQGAIADLMNNADYYLKLSEGDMCSNALIEALAFGLPVIYDLKGGGAAEIAAPFGIAFSSEDMQSTIEKARALHQDFVMKIAAHRDSFLITHTAEAYVETFRKVVN